MKYCLKVEVHINSHWFINGMKVSDTLTQRWLFANTKPLVDALLCCKSNRIGLGCSEFQTHLKSGVFEDGRAHHF